MWQIGVWEQEEGLAERVAALVSGCRAMVRACRHPALLAGQETKLQQYYEKVSEQFGRERLVELIRMLRELEEIMRVDLDEEEDENDNAAASE